MEENKEKKINWKPYIIATIISLIFAGGMFCLVFFGFKKHFVDGLAYGGVLLLGGALLIWITREGFFDIFSYGFKQFGTTLFGKKANKYNDFSGYKEYKNIDREKRSKYYLAVGAVGLLFLTLTLIFYLIYML